MLLSIRSLHWPLDKITGIAAKASYMIICNNSKTAIFTAKKEKTVGKLYTSFNRKYGVPMKKRSSDRT
jgi:hypothetical protein